MWFLLQSKQDIQKFIDKFGQELYDRFLKNKQRLSAKGQSADILFYVKNYDIEQMQNLLYDIENKVVKDETGKTKNNVIKVAENEYYTVYDVLDWQTAMNLGDGTEWCISGRFNTGEEVKPSQAKQYFDSYKSLGFQFYLFCIPKKQGFQKYCINVFNKDSYEVWDSQDISLGESSPSQIPLINYKGFKLLPVEDVPKSLDIVDARLLQLDQLKSYDKKFRPLFNYCDNWWLSTPADEVHILCVLSETYGSIYDRSTYLYYFVRPVLEIKNLQQSGFKVGDRFMFGEVPFKIISNTMAFCLADIGAHCFRKDLRAEDVTDYEESDVKKYIDEWLYKAKKEQ